MGGYPIWIRLSESPVVVIGGGKVAERKIKPLRSMGAKITLVSPQLTPGLESLARQNKIHWVRRAYQRGDLSGALLGFAATDDPKVNRQVAEEADSCKILVNVSTDPEASSFHLPSFFSRGAIQVAVSTGGRSPALAASLRKELSLEVDAAYGVLVELLGEVRASLKASDLRPAERSKILSALVDSDLLDLIREALKSNPGDRNWGKVVARVGRLCGVSPVSGRWDALDFFQEEQGSVEEGDGLED
jgi:precorrin-2 dehydrogenase/sirohydrochlorin ferrochelatase